VGATGTQLLNAEVAENFRGCAGNFCKPREFRGVALGKGTLIFYAGGAEVRLAECAEGAGLIAKGFHVKGGLFGGSVDQAKGAMTKIEAFLERVRF
jgi:hypothetical protein